MMNHSFELILFNEPVKLIHKLQWMINSHIGLIWWAQAQYYLCVHKWDPSP